MARPTRRTAVVTATLLATATVVTGCGGQDPNVAASLNGQTVSESDVDDVGRDFHSLPDVGAAQLSRAQIAQLLVYQPMLVEAAQGTSVAVPEWRLREQLATQLPDASPATVRFLQASGILQNAQMLQQKGQTQRLTPAETKVLTTLSQKLQSTTPTFNPRYVPAQGENAPNWLAAPDNN